LIYFKNYLLAQQAHDAVSSSTTKINLLNSFR